MLPLYLLVGVLLERATHIRAPHLNPAPRCASCQHAIALAQSDHQQWQDWGRGQRLAHLALGAALWPMGLWQSLPILLGCRAEPSPPSTNQLR